MHTFLSFQNSAKLLFEKPSTNFLLKKKLFLDVLHSNVWVLFNFIKKNLQTTFVKHCNKYY